MSYIALAETKASREVRVRFDMDRLMPLHAELKNLERSARNAWLAKQHKIWKAIEEVRDCIVTVDSTISKVSWWCIACRSVRVIS